MKKTITIALALVLALSLLTACGSNDNTGSTGGNSNTPGTSQGGGDNGGNDSAKWPDNEYTAGLSKPNGTLQVVTEQATHNELTISMKWELADAQEWIKSLEKAGYTGEEEKGNPSLYIWNGENDKFSIEIQVKREGLDFGEIRIVKK
jgi:hypothetical protein